MLVKIWTILPVIDTAHQTKVNKKYDSISKLGIQRRFGLQGEFYSCYNVHRREGLSSMHRSPPALELPSLGAKPLLFKRSCGVFRLMWSEGIVWCMRENVEGKVECVCMWAWVRVAVHVTWQGYISQRAAGPDVWLPLTVHSRRDWSGAGPTPSPPFPRTKARAQLKDVNSVAFVAKAQRHAEWEIWPLPRGRLCFRTPLAVSGSSGQQVSERIGEDGVGAGWRGVKVCPKWWGVQVGGGVMEEAARGTSPASNLENNKLK